MEIGELTGDHTTPTYSNHERDQRRHFHQEFLLIWMKWSRRSNVLSDWLILLAVLVILPVRLKPNRTGRGHSWPCWFGVKLQENLLSTLWNKNTFSCRKVFRIFWTSDMTSKNGVLMYILTFFVRSLAAMPQCRPLLSARFYCCYRQPERVRSPAGLRYTVRHGASQNLNQFLVPGHEDWGGWQILGLALSLALSNCSAAPIWASSWNWQSL